RRSRRTGEGVGSCQLTKCPVGTLQGGAAEEHVLPFSSRENLPGSSPAPLGEECCLTPNRDKAEGACGLSASQGQMPVGFTPERVAEFGLTQENFTIGASPATLKFRRRAAIGARGSPENNSLIQFLAQQRSNRQKEALAQVSPFKHVRLLKDKIDTFQTSVKAVEEETGTPGLSRVAEASQETGFCFGSEHCTRDAGMDVLSDLTSEQEGSPVCDESRLCISLPHTSTHPSRPLLAGHAQSSCWLPPVPRRTPERQPLERMQECSYDALDGGGESLAVSSCAEVLEALQTEETERQSSEKPKEKKVTFGKDLSPEIFDEALPANAPLHRGGTPVRLQRQSSPSARLSLTQEPLPQPSFDRSEEWDPLEGLMQDSVAADLVPAENAEAAESSKPDRMKTRSSTKRKQCSTTSEGTAVGISSDTAPENTNDMNNPRQNKHPNQKNTTTSAAKKLQKRKRAGCVRRRKKVKTSLYGERTMASQKPLLSPVIEVSECSLSPSSVFFSEDVISGGTKPGSAYEDVQQKPVAERMRGQTICAADTSGSSEGLDVAEGSSSHDTVFQVSGGDLESAAGTDQEFSHIVPDASSGFDTSDCVPQGEETARVREAEGSTSLTESKRLKGDLLSEAEWVAGLDFLEQDTGVHAGARGALQPQQGSARGDRRRTRSGAVPFPAFQQEDTTEDNFPLPSFHVEEFLSASQPKRDRSEPPGGGAVRVRRSMRLQEDAHSKGLAWVLLPEEVQNCPPRLAPARKFRRRTTVLRGSENLQHGEQNLSQFPAAGKENKGSALPAAACRWPRRRCLCTSTPREAAAGAPACRRSIVNLLCWKGRGGQSHSEEAEIPLHSS
ncbi:cell division cycle-associated protein 2, partial [Indicator indicator]|uniref:cell division cycle-associated protein 2 n=1 Tax=Indicator indicator TaxID=1002788 RepID=UPI0023DF219A